MNIICAYNIRTNTMHKLRAFSQYNFVCTLRATFLYLLYYIQYIRNITILNTMYRIPTLPRKLIVLIAVIEITILFHSPPSDFFHLLYTRARRPRFCVGICSLAHSSSMSFTCITRKGRVKLSKN